MSLRGDVQHRRAALKYYAINDLFNNFSGPASYNALEAYGGGIQLSDLIKNILICVPKMNEGHTGLEQHEGE